MNMVVQWMINNVAISLWRGHKSRAVNLNENGIRQGCVLSPLLYLIIINTIGDPGENIVMPEWDKGAVEQAFANDFKRDNNAENTQVLSPLFL